MLKEYLAAGYPILAVRTCEPERAEKELLWELFNAQYYNEGTKPYQCYSWDFVNKIRQWGVIDSDGGGRQLSYGVITEDDEQAQPAVSPLLWFNRQPNGAVLFVWNYHKFLTPQAIGVIQSLQNFRDDWKQRQKSLVMLVPEIDIVKELDKSITIIDFNLPDKEKLTGVLNDLARGNGIEINGSKETLVNAAAGLTLFEAENAFALSFSHEHGTFDPLVVMEQKAQMVKKNACLEYSHFKETFSAIGGLDNLKQFCTKIIKSPLSKGVLLLGVPGTGKCLGRGTPILMYNGTIKTVEDIQTGDLLMGPDSKPRKVMGVCEGYGPLYRISPVKGDPYIVNESHVLSLKHSPTHGGVHEVVNIPLHDYIGKTKQWRERHKGWRCGVDWKETGVLIPPYILGLWLGDGDANTPRVTTPDKEAVGAMQDYCNATGLRLVVNSEKGLAKTYSMSTKKGGHNRNRFLDSLRHYGLNGNKNIPHDYLVNSEKVRLELLAGIIDADGHYTNNCYDIVFVNKQLAEDTIFLARSLGFAAYLRPCKKGCQGGHVGMYWRFHISGNTAHIPTRVGRKKAKTRRQCKDVTVTGIKVEAIGNGEYYGFELDGDHLFLLGDFTVTHNSAFAKALGNEAGMPTLQLDLGRVFGSLVGQSEGKIREALRIVDAMAPCILFVDEIEKGLSGANSSGQTDSGVTSRVFGTFLTWLNDHQSQVFVIATSNNIKGVPPEFFRAGRFDATFFVNLPTPEEQEKILQIYLQKYDLRATIPDIIPEITDWTGAEIETLCRNARMLGSLKESAKYIVPIHRSRGKEINELREYARNNCVPASIPQTQVKTQATRRIRPSSQLEN